MSNRMQLAVAAVLGTVVVGCGSSGPSLSAFRSGFQADKAQLTQLGRDLQTAVQGASGKTNSQIATEFAGLSARTSQQASQLRRLNPPSKYKSQRDQLASDLTTVASDLSAISSAASSNNGPAARTASSKLIQDSAAARTVDRALTASLGLPQSG